jgi:hypothetical protein
MRKLTSAVAAIVVLASLLAARPVTAPTPVVVELFTSEGCSSCPPADALLTKLENEGVVAGVQVIPLGLHVTYWDQLGWKDPASLPEATDRQQEYGRGLFGVDNVYTPQAVVDGRTQLVGSDEAALRKAIAKAAAEPHVSVHLTAAVQPAGVIAKVEADSVSSVAREPVQNVFFLTEDGLTSIVKRGENGGRTLHNDAVVRRITTNAAIGGLNPAWQRDRLRVTVIVQGKKTHRIYGAASTPLT